MTSVSVSELKNIGTTLANRLRKIDIFTRDDLEKMGAARAYNLLCQMEQKRLPTCYNLYSLEAALRGHDWRQLGNEDKQKLRDQVTSL